MKTITIDGKEYKIECNAFTKFEYKRIFSRGIFADISILARFSEKQEELKKRLKEENKSDEEIEKALNTYSLENMDDFIDVMLRICYILIYTANNNKFETFENWLKTLTKVDVSDDWCGEVTELAVNSFC